MLVKTYAAALQSIQARTVTIEVSCTRGSYFQLVGLPDTAIKESQDRIISAIESSGYKFPGKRIVINMSPADLRKEGAAYDLPLAIGLLAADGQIPSDLLEHYMIMGELSLDGAVRPIHGALPIAIQARSEGYRGFILPEANAREAAVVNKLEVHAARTLREVIGMLTGEAPLPIVEVDTRGEFYRGIESETFDFSEVKGQENREASARSRGSWRSQPPNDRCPREWEVYDGEATAQYPSTFHARRKSRDNKDLFGSWEVG